MDIQAIQFKQMQKQTAIQIMQASSVKTVTAGAVKRDTISISKDGIFTSVSIYAEAVEAYYGTGKISGTNTGVKTNGSKDKDFPPIDEEKLAEVTLPRSYDSLKDTKCYYHGQSISEYDLIRLAVAEGKMEVTEDKIAIGAAFEAFRVMIEDEATTKYPWSSTKYSEDGKYTFTKKEDGTYERHLVQNALMGASLDDIANWIASGTPNRNIERRYLDYLRSCDPELYEAAQNIGREVRNYTLLTECYKTGVIGEAQHDYDLNLLAFIFSTTGSEKFYSLFSKAKSTGDFTDFFTAYQPEAAKTVQDTRLEQISKTGGIF